MVQFLSLIHNKKNKKPRLTGECNIAALCRDITINNASLMQVVTTKSRITVNR